VPHQLVVLNTPDVHQLMVLFPMQAFADSPSPPHHTTQHYATPHQLMVLFPMIAFSSNTVINIMDKGVCPFPYFKLVCLFGILFIGVFAHLVNNCVKRRVARTAASRW
jgi:hypothetical protein